MGISPKAVSVAEQGNIRAVEFSSNLSRPTLHHILETVAKAIMNPIEKENKIVVKPECIALLETAILSIKERTALSEMLSAFSIKLLLMSELEQFPDLKNARVSASSPTGPVPLSAMIPPTPTGPQEPLPFNPPQSRGCIFCKKDIVGKASQCSACKAVIYDSVECAVRYLLSSIIMQLLEKRLA